MQLVEFRRFPISAANAVSRHAGSQSQPRMQQRRNHLVERIKSSLIEEIPISKLLVAVSLFIRRNGLCCGKRVTNLFLILSNRNAKILQQYDPNRRPIGWNGLC